MNDAQARAVILRAWARTGGPRTLTELQTVQAIARYESGASYGNGSSHNWGSIQTTHAPPCGPNEIELTDHRADGTPYQACFRKYDTDEDGAAALIYELTRRPAVAAALDSGNATRVANAMHDTKYFEANPAGYAKGIANVAKSIAATLREPQYLSLTGPAITSSPAGEIGGALIIAAIAYFIWRDLRTRGPWRGRRARDAARRGHHAR